MNLRSCLAELIGTFALIFVGMLVVQSNAGPSGSIVAVALGHGLVIAVMVSATAAVSGGHLNPAVTFGMLVVRKIGFPQAIAYMISQLIGATVGAAAALWLLGRPLLESVEYATPRLAPGMDATRGMVMEAIATFFLVFVIFGTAVDRRAPKVGGLFIGLTITLGILAIGPHTGGAINPARWFGPAAIGGGFLDWFPYIAGPLLGGAVAAVLYTGLMEDRSQPVDS